MILGKFMPPHLGHVFAVEFARRFADPLTVLVCSLDREPIPGRSRFEWMRELFPSCDVRHVTDDLPQEPADHPDFWVIWRSVVLANTPAPPRYVFASEQYGFKLAEVLGAQFIPVDIARSLVPVSGTAIRTQPMANWQYLPACVRPHFVKRVCVFGPESTGKTTLARDLATHFRTVWVAEFARGLLDHKNGQCDPADIELIARGQPAAEDALARHANRVLFCDTDVLTTTIWADELFGRCPEWVRSLADQRTYDLYLLLDVDVPWVDDRQRYLPHRRREFFEKCEAALRRCGRPYVVLRGGWNERFEAAVRATERLLHQS